MGLPDERGQLDLAPVGMWSCSYAERTLGECLDEINKAWRLVNVVDVEWAKNIKAKVCSLSSYTQGC